MKVNPKVALLALAIGAFAIGTTEFTPMGLLPVIADGVQVGIPTAGMLVTAYAVGVMLGAPVMTLLFSRFGKRAALMSLMVLFTIGNLLSAMAPNYATLLASRLVTSLNHGAFFGLGAVVAASVVPKDKQASAVAAMFMGLTIANIGGVPAATWVGQQVGWRVAFAGTAALGLIAMAALWLALPRGERGSVPDVRRELAVITRPSVLLAMATTVVGAGAMFTLYTYVAPVLAELTGASDAFVTLALVLIGVGFTLGNSLGGRLADWSLDGSTRIFLAALAVIMLLLPLALTNHVAAALGLLVWGVATFGLVPPCKCGSWKPPPKPPAWPRPSMSVPSTLATRSVRHWAAVSSAWAWVTSPYRWPVACWLLWGCCWYGWGEPARSPKSIWPSSPATVCD